MILPRFLQKGLLLEGGYTTGDVCLSVLSDLYKDFKAYSLLESIDSLELGYQAYMAKSKENKERFKKLVGSWFENNKEKFVWVVDNKLYTISEDEFDTRKRKNPIGGFYVMKGIVN